MDLRAIECSSKGRAQDKAYNPDVPEIDQLLAAGREGLDFLVDHVASERPLHEGQWCLGVVQDEGQVASVLLMDFFTDETWLRRSLPELCDPDLSPLELPPGERENLWRSLLNRYGDRLRWDPDGRYFLAEGVPSCDPQADGEPRP